MSSGNNSNPFGFPTGTIVFLPNRFIYVPTNAPPLTDERFHCFSTDSSLIYFPFENDFGPLNIGQTYAFFAELSQKLRSNNYKNKCILYYSSPVFNYRANSVAMCALFMLMVLNRTADDIANLLKKQLAGCPLTPFRDCGLSPVSSHPMTVYDMLYAFEFANKKKLFDITSFNYQDFMFYSSVENGDLTWIIPKQIIAFAGPISETHAFYRHHPFTPKSYIPLFKDRKVTAVIRLNENCYNREDFIRASIRHYDMPYPDGSCPSDTMIRQFIKIAYSEISQGGAIAVHCRAGLGRTATLIGCYLIWRYGFTAVNVIAYMRTLRPGSVIGQQQRFLIDAEKRIHTIIRPYNVLTGNANKKIDNNDVDNIADGTPSYTSTSSSTNSNTLVKSQQKQKLKRVPDILVEEEDNPSNKLYSNINSARVDAKSQYITGVHHVDPQIVGLTHSVDSNSTSDLASYADTLSKSTSVKNLNRNSDPLFSLNHIKEPTLNHDSNSAMFRSTTDLHTPIGVANAVNDTVYGKNALYSSSVLRTTAGPSKLKNGNVILTTNKAVTVSGVKGISWSSGQETYQTPKILNSINAHIVANQK